MVLSDHPIQYYVDVPPRHSSLLTPIIFTVDFIGLARTVSKHRMLCNSPAKNTVYTPHIYGSG
jgi:hypothetical protein